MDGSSDQSKFSISASSTKLSEPDNLVELAHHIQTCTNFINANACSRLRLIAEQMQFLKLQAEKIIRDVERDKELHNLPCNFIKKSGNVYYIYQKPDNTRYFSMLSPKEWGNPPHKYVGAYRLLSDMSWVPENKCANHALEHINLVSRSTNEPEDHMDSEKYTEL